MTNRASFRAQPGAVRDAEGPGLGEAQRSEAPWGPALDGPLGQDSGSPEASEKTSPRSVGHHILGHG